MRAGDGVLTYEAMTLATHGPRYRQDLTLTLPPLLISRRPRALGSGWDQAASWFGGRPRLGARSWPRSGANQLPFFFLAQIDLAEVGRELVRAGATNPFPSGALAFFVGSGG